MLVGFIDYANANAIVDRMPVLQLLSANNNKMLGERQSERENVCDATVSISSTHLLTSL